MRNSNDGRRQEGISFLLIDMKTPGIEVRAIHSIDGEHHLNAVFFKDVRVPQKNRVGEEGKGWTIAKYLLSHERTGIAGVPMCKSAIQGLKDVARTDPGLRGDQNIARRIAELEVDLLALEFTNLRALERAQEGKPASVAAPHGRHVCRSAADPVDDPDGVAAPARPMCTSSASLWRNKPCNYMAASA